MEDQPLLKKQPNSYYGQAGCFNRWIFWFAFHIVRRGQGGNIRLEDLEPNLDENESKLLGDQLEATLKLPKIQSSKRPLLKALFTNFGWGLALQSWNSYIRDGICRITQYVLLGRFIYSFRPKATNSETGFYSCLLILSVFVFGQFTERTLFSAGSLALKMRVAVTSIIYRKSLRLSQRALCRVGGVGKITNLIANDAAAFDMAVLFSPLLITASLTILSVGVVMWMYAGIAALVALSISLSFIPLQLYASRKFAKLRTDGAACTDYRLRLINEILNGILLIKMSCWETCFSELVEDARKSEVKFVSQKDLVSAVVNSLIQIIPKLALFATLITYVFLGNKLTSETGFIVLAMCNGMAIFTSNWIPYAILYSSETAASIRRIQEFLQEEEQQSEHLDKGLEPQVTMTRVTTRWAGQPDDALRGVDLSLKPGKFLCIIGSVGSGKSTLLHTILQETEITSGTLQVRGRIAYTSQVPCIFPGTIRQNITFGTPFDSTWYDQVIAACALERDFELLPFRDMSTVGDKGVTLSGGQKARISLARAIYRNADIYLLDDPLSSVDVTSGRHIYDQCIRGLLKAKCVVLVTHLTRYMAEADEVLVLDNGSVIGSGTPQDVRGQWSDEAEEMDVVDDIIQDKESDANKNTDKPQKMAVGAVDSNGTGTVGIGVFWKYLRTGNAVWFVSVVLLFYVLSQTVLSGSDIYLQEWVSGEEGMSKGHILSERRTYIFTYSMLMIPALILPFICNFSFFWLCLRSTTQLHTNLLRAVIHAKMHFFETTHTGWILNRFSKDMMASDESIPQNARVSLRVLLQGIGILAVVSYENPWMIISSIILLTIVILVRRYYLTTASSITRLEASSIKKRRQGQ